ncbi:MAG: TonB-dependent receptor plug domain-containing protein, partial [Saprospiraceae bacterium]|nr:TonB-dependent receptor plug domain-containing protein [Saprospiraceae bacterium]
MLRTFWILCLGLIPAFAVSQNITGIVTDKSTSEPLIGANILVKSTRLGTSTDIDGRFSLAAQIGDTLVFSYTGYQSIENVIVSTSTPLTVALSVTNIELTELVVIGYGTTTVKDNTGSVASLSEKDFNQGNIVTPENLLNGRVAGVTVSTGGAPGSGSAIRIRGGSSLSASNDPLIVINGLPISNSAIGGGRSILSTINPADIASFTVLKDASATAIYGSRASNGVIIITTKDGGKNLKVDFNTQLGYSTLPNTLDIYSADEFRALVAERRPDLVNKLGTANTDWQDEIYDNTLFQNYNLAVTGTLLKKVPTRLSLGFTNQPGIRITSQFERRSASLNRTPTFLNATLAVRVNVNASQERSRFASGQVGN